MGTPPCEASQSMHRGDIDDEYAGISGSAQLANMGYAASSGRPAYSFDSVNVTGMKPPAGAKASSSHGPLVDSHFDREFCPSRSEQLVHDRGALVDQPSRDFEAVKPTGFKI